MTNLESEIKIIVDKYVDQLFDKLVIKNNMNKRDLNIIWEEITGKKITTFTAAASTAATATTAATTSTTGTTSTTATTVTTAVAAEDVGSQLNVNMIMGLTVPELKALCKANKLSTSGKKQDLIDKLVSISTGAGDNSGNNAINQNPVVSKVGDVETPVPRKKKRSPNRMPNIPISSIQIKKNQFENYEHPETKLVFDKETRQVIGKQQDDGTISELTEEDIQKCDQFKFSYRIPEKIINEEEKQLASLSNEDDIVETLEDIIGSDDEFEEFYEEQDE
jgi:hypothetical protein